MRLKTVTYSRTIQVAQYEPETLQLEVEVGEGETSEEVFEALRDTVHYLLDVPLPEKYERQS